MDSLYNRIKGLVAPVRYAVARRRLRNNGVCIIANNCWGGFMYRYFRIPFSSPFIGLFVMAPDYIRILESPGLLELPLCFIEPSSSRYPDTVRAQNRAYPIAVLGDTDIEIHFLHYGDEDEAREKWNRRLGRIDWDNAIVAFHDGDGFTPELLARFDRLPYRCKVCFTSRPYPGYSSAVYLPEFAGCDRVGRTWKLSDLHFDLVAAANGLMSSGGRTS